MCCTIPLWSDSETGRASSRDQSRSLADVGRFRFHCRAKKNRRKPPTSGGSKVGASEGSKETPCPSKRGLANGPPNVSPRLPEPTKGFPLGHGGEERVTAGPGLTSAIRTSAPAQHRRLPTTSGTG